MTHRSGDSVAGAGSAPSCGSFEGSQGGPRYSGRAASSAWTLLGIAALFASAIYRLGGRGVATVQDGLGTGEWVALVVLTLAFVYGEGFRALERRWVPRVVVRARRVRRERSLVVHLLAPLYGLSLIGASRKETARAWAGTLAIVLAVLVVRSFPEPWRGITDFAVAAALAWGLAAIVRGVPSALR